MKQVIDYDLDTLGISDKEASAGNALIVSQHAQIQE